MSKPIAQAILGGCLCGVVCYMASINAWWMAGFAMLAIFAVMTG
jgi:hypothetical protein